MIFLYMISAPDQDRVAYLDSLDAYMEYVALEKGVDADILRAIAWVSSRYHHRRCPSLYGSIGLMDIRDFSLPGPSISLQTVCGGRRVNLDGIKGYLASSWRASVDYAAGLLSKYLSLCKGELACALERYGGPFFAVDVLRVYRDGLQHILSIEPHPSTEIPVLTSLYDADCSPQPQFDFVDAFIPADPSNYTDASRPSDYPVSYVIIHTTQGSYSGTISWFQNPDANVSAHYVIRSSDGESTQMVCHNDIAWHAGNWDYNTWSVGIEHEGYVEENGWYTDSLYASSARISAALSRTYGFGADRLHIIGHYEVPGATHTDPGPYWDWPLYMAYVNGKRIADTLVDELDMGFIRYGTYDSWWFDTLGYSGHFLWTYAWTGQRDNWAVWNPILPFPGWYEVKAYIPAMDSTLSLVRYMLIGLQGTTQVWVDQEEHKGGWVVLDTVAFGAGAYGYVVLTDTTSDPSRAYQVVTFDALAFSYLGPLEGCTQRVVDDANPGWNAYGSWSLSSYSGYAGDYHYAYTYSQDSVIYDPAITCPGGYHLRTWIRKSSNRTTQARYRIHSIDGDTTVFLSQYSPVMDTGWVEVGTFCLDSSSSVVLYSSAVDGDVVISDAIEFVYDSAFSCSGSVAVEEVGRSLIVSPAVDGSVRIISPVGRSVSINIFDAMGRVVGRKRSILAPGENVLRFELPSGVYILRVDGKSYRWLVLR